VFSSNTYVWLPLVVYGVALVTWVVNGKTSVNIVKPEK